MLTTCHLYLFLFWKIIKHKSYNQPWNTRQSSVFYEPAYVTRICKYFRILKLQNILITDTVKIWECQNSLILSLVNNHSLIGKLCSVSATCIFFCFVNYLKQHYSEFRLSSKNQKAEVYYRKHHNLGYYGVT